MELLARFAVEDLGFAVAPAIEPSTNEAPPAMGSVGPTSMSYALEQLGGIARVTDIATESLVKVPNMTAYSGRRTPPAGTERTTVP